MRHMKNNPQKAVQEGSFWATFLTMCQQFMTGDSFKQHKQMNSI